MLKITSPYIRETSVNDDREGKAIVIKIDPPGNTIGFRLRYGRQTWCLNVKEAYHAARYTANPETKEKPKRVQTSYKAELLNVLQAHGKLNIAQVLQKMKEKRMPMTRAQAGEWLDTLKEMRQVKQEGFSYQLIK